MLASTAAVAAQSNSPFDLVNGIPLHPLVVHAAVVLVPLSALGVLLMAAVPRVSRKLGWLVVLAALAATGACFVAKLAGEQLAERVGEPGFDHQSLGDLMPFFAAALAAIAAGLWLVDRRRVNDQPTPRGVVGIVVAVVAAVIAAGNLWWVYRVGDSGARSVWTGVVATSELPSSSPSPTPSLTPTVPATPAPSASATATASAAAAAASYSMAQVAAHNVEGDCWLVIDGAVYDLTAWIPQHPGGPQRIIPQCGTDATDEFSTQHDGEAMPAARLATYQLGQLVS